MEHSRQKNMTSNTIINKWQNLPIFAKFMIGFIMPAIVLTYAGISIVQGFNQLEDTLQKGNQDNKTAIEYLHILDLNLEHSAQSLGFYLLSKEEIYKTQYVNAVEKLVKYSTKMQTDISPQYYAEHKLDALPESLNKLAAYKDQLLMLATDDGANFPAMRYAGKSVNPIMRTITQQIELMVESESSEDATEERKQLLMSINALRITWNKELSELRTYLAFKAEVSIENIKTYRDSVKNITQTLYRYEDLLTLEQIDALEQITPLIKEYDTNVDKLMQLHSSE